MPVLREEQTPSITPFDKMNVSTAFLKPKNKTENDNFFQLQYSSTNHVHHIFEDMQQSGNQIMYLQRPSSGPGTSVNDYEGDGLFSGANSFTS